MAKLDVVRLYLEKKYEIEIDATYVYDSKDAGRIFQKELGGRNVECVGLICLDSTYRLINYADISIGAVNGVHANTAEIFKIALLCNASKLFIAHNHPSNILSATTEDIIMTKNIGSVAKLFHMELIDSLIVGNSDQVTSIREQNERSKL